MRVPHGPARLAALVLAGCSFMLVTADGQIAYQKPHREILDVLQAKLPPMISVSPQKDRLLLMDRVAYPSIAELARPMQRLAGLRIDPANNGRHAPTIYTGITIRDIAPGGEDRIVALPHDVTIGEASWSHSGQYFAFPWYRPGHVELWVVDVATAKARPIAGVALNQTVSAAIQWLPDGKTLLVRTVPTGRAAPPSPALVPAGPTIQQSDGAAAPVRTYQDLLENSHDEDLFEYFTTSQPVLVDAGHHHAVHLRPHTLRSLIPLMQWATGMRPVPPALGPSGSTWPARRACGPRRNVPAATGTRLDSPGTVPIPFGVTAGFRPRPLADLEPGEIARNSCTQKLHLFPVGVF